VQEQEKATEPASRKRTALKVGAITAAALASAAIILWAVWFFRQRETHGHHPDYGDVPTWLAAVVVLPGIALAFWQLRREIRGQAEEARRRDGEAKKQRKHQRLTDKVLRKQIERLDSDAVAARRRQASLIVMSTGPESGFKWPERDAVAPAPPVRLSVRVMNRSSRPIRNITCRLWDPTAETDCELVKAGEFEPFGSPDGEPFTLRPFTVTYVPVLQAGVHCGFVFDQIADARSYQSSVTFTDDEDQKWHINHEQRLRLVDPEAD
jgi:hypothetical protein